jgi:hypothetical protein
MESFKEIIKRTLLNLPGWHTKRKIVVIESDDWGSIRMPSREVYEILKKHGLNIDNDPYCKFDSLANSRDLSDLFDVLTCVKDKNGRSAVLTANTILANPDFDKIKSSGYKEYFFEPFYETLKREPYDPKAIQLWNEGIKNHIFWPQYHGREHLYVKKWLKDLQNGNELTHLAFNYRTFGLTNLVDSRIKGNYMGAFNSSLTDDIISFNKILEEGAQIFKKQFGYTSLSFIPTTYTWHPSIEFKLKSIGIKYLQGLVFQRIPLDDDNSFKYKRTNFTGFKSKAGLIYLNRNVFFEPSIESNIDWLTDCLNRIKIAFLCRKPAIIGSHRLNFIGSIFPENRERNLLLLKTLLKEIIKKFPDVEFMSSDELGALIDKTSKK